MVNSQNSGFYEIKFPLDGQLKENQPKRFAHRGIDDMHQQMKMVILF